MLDFDFKHVARQSPYHRLERIGLYEQLRPSPVRFFSNQNQHDRRGEGQSDNNYKRRITLYKILYAVSLERGCRLFPDACFKAASESITANRLSR